MIELINVLHSLLKRMNARTTCYANAVAISVRFQTSGEESRKGNDIKKEEERPAGPINRLECEKNKEGTYIQALMLFTENTFMSQAELML